MTEIGNPRRAGELERLVRGEGQYVGDVRLPGLLHLAFAEITAAALWALARRSFDQATAWLALAVFLGTPLVVVWARVADIDLAVSCFLFLAIAAALRAAGCLEEAGGAGARPWLRGGEGVERALHPGP